MRLTSKYISYTFLLFNILAAVGIAFIEDYNTLFLTALLVNLLLCFLYRNIFKQSAVAIARTLIGAVFIYSGFVKGVDPIGTEYVIGDYLAAYGLYSLDFLALFGSFMLNALEFTIGILLVLNVKLRFTIIITSLMMAFFTLTTLYDALANPVPDCGCFGKALVITNWQTFYKNLILDALVIVVLFSSKYMRVWFAPKKEIVIISITVVLSLFFQAWNYRYLPVINFLDWKVGKVMMPEKTLPVLNYATYKNTISGEEREYLTSEIPHADTSWANNWQWTGARIDDPNPKATDIALIDKIDDADDGYDMTESLLNAGHFHFLLVVYDLKKANEKGMKKTLEFMDIMDRAGYAYTLLTSSSVKDAEAFKAENNLRDLQVYYADDISLKAMVRANPGILLIKNSVVLGIWSWTNLPEPLEVKFAELEKKYIKN